MDHVDADARMRMWNLEQEVERLAGVVEELERKMEARAPNSHQPAPGTPKRRPYEYRHRV